MFIYLILLFTILPALELAILIKVGAHIGVMPTLLLIVFTGVLGAYLARLQGFYILNKIQNELNRGLMPQSELVDGLLILIGGIVLLTPGFVTDTFGFLLLIPWSRNLIKLGVTKYFQRMIKKGEGISIWSRSQDQHRPPGFNDYDDIDVN